MVASRQLLYRSAFWEIARPRHPLTAGHVLIRLSDPSTEFAHPSAADWLFCHGLVRAAMANVLGVTRCAIMFTHQWHPLGSAIGEPVAESSTPTFHLFGRWAGETTTPGQQLSLPAHRRKGEPDHDMEATDAAMREALRLARPETMAGFDAMARSGVEPYSGPEPLVRAVDAGPRHTVIQPVRKVAAISEVRPVELLAMGAALTALPQAGGFSGVSCVALEGASPGPPVRVHAVRRSAAEDVNPLEDLLNLPEVSLALL
ncbi:hypothetical protein [Paenarthrobacter sp. 4246]|uniref:hypothetical protein n=1 Tax=Paenarthrobacter sp. 4246 TaxID=3156456 RepID=UPI0033946180